MHFTHLIYMHLSHAYSYNIDFPSAQQPPCPLGYWCFCKIPITVSQSFTVVQLWTNLRALAPSVRYQRTDGHSIREGLAGGMNPQKHLEFSSLVLWCPAALECISEKITADPLLQRWSHESTVIRSAALSGGLKCSS